MGESLLELRGEYENFLRGERYNLTERIATAIDDFQHIKSDGVCPRITLSMAELRSEGFSERLRLDPLRHLRALEAACHLIALEEKPGYDEDGNMLKVALTGPLGATPASPRQLTSSSLRQLVCVEGVSTKVSTIKPKVVKSVHYCPKTKKRSHRNYVDATDPNLGLPVVDASGTEIADRYVGITTSVYPSKDEDGELLETEYGLSTYKDHQTVSLQEMPEKAPMGQLPRSVELILDYDLVDKVKPGDRVMIMGVYRALATAAQGQQQSGGVFRTVILVNNVQILGRDVSHLSFHSQDVRKIRSLSQRKDILNVLGRSIAPSIHGHHVIKKALALQLLSGVEKNLDNGTHLRGDINILMVGDPSTAKSQLLRSAMTIAPLAVSTTGKGSSGVGLTAAVTSDPDTRERRLEAGAMVLADRGLVCVDEFDKMGENDRVAIHEAMEQQTVTIAKAGIHASLNARCSVLAAANPVYGQYDRRRRIQENIGLPDSLLSRFDLLFVVLDQMDPELDRKIATHVVRGHRNRTTKHRDHEDEFEDEDQGQSIWQRSCGDEESQEILQLDFLRKYLHYAKTRIKPILTESSREFIAARYAEMRARQDDRTIPITARSLETVIRLATAHAKARLSDTVLTQDCLIAMDILSFALYHEQNAEKQPPSDKDVEMANDATAGVSDNGEEEPDENLPPSKRSRPDTKSVQEEIWDILLENDDHVEEEVLSQALSNHVDKETMKSALTELASVGQIQITDGVIYKY